MIRELLLATSVLTVMVANGLLSAVYLLSRGLCRLDPARVRVSAPLTIVRPLHGMDGRSALSNRTLVEQLYAHVAAIQFVASRSTDEGLALAHGAHRLDPRVTCVVAPPASGVSTDKARKMAAGWASSGTPFVAFCDADIVLPPGIIDECMQRFDDPRVGAVFAPVVHCGGSVLSSLLAQLSSGDKLAAIRSFDRLGILGVLEGGLMILRRSAVEHVGGIEVIAETVADDLRLGAALRGGGFRLHAGPAIRHELGDLTLVQSIAQYHRWMVCQRSESPELMWPQMLFHPIVVPLFVVAFAPESMTAWLTLIGSIVWRIVLTASIERSLLKSMGLRFGWWILVRPMADLVHFCFGLSAYLFPFVSWGGFRYHLGRRGRIVAAAPVPCRRSPLAGSQVSSRRQAIVRLRLQELLSALWAALRRVTHRVLVRSAVVGAVATLADLSLLLLLTRALQIRPALANVPTLTLGLLIQFCGNKYFTFADRTARVVRQAARFLGVEAFTLLFNVAAFHLLAVLLHVPVLPARVLGTLAVYVGFSLPAWRRVVFSGATGVVKEAPSKSARSGPGSTHPSPSTSTARRELHSAHETRG